jgi:inorganic pyrophosphatase
MTRHDLSRLPLQADDGGIRVVIETPLGSFNKYDYDPDLDIFEVMETLPRGSEFPFDFGFFPSTLGDDGDPVDALTLSDRGLAMGAVVSTRLIGVIEFSDEKEGETVRNDRLIAVPTISVIYKKINTLEDLPPALLDQIEAFFEQDAYFKGKKRKFLGRGDAKAASVLLAKGKTAFKKKG